jgi:catechol 2,3-dioxygenase-like lactoylglutathione lyase family enzyme
MSDQASAFALHHVQLCMPRGAEAAARDFYAGVLGLAEITKPPALAARGGVWFRAGTLELHLGVEDDFQPARKAHPGILVDDLDGLDARLRAHGLQPRPDENFPGYRRFYLDDCFGNRLEFLSPSNTGETGAGPVTSER